MKKVFLLTFLLSFTFTVKAQSFLSLDSCRALALANNKDLLISNEKISAAHYQRKAAFTNYLPNFSATGAYMRNQIWGIQRSGFFNGRGKWAKGFENQRV